MKKYNHITHHKFILKDEFFENFTSIHTRKNYLIDINQFLNWIHLNFEINNYSDIKKNHIIKYRNYLSGENNDVDIKSKKISYTPKTINRKLASLSSYFKYLIEEDHCKENPVLSVKRPRPDVKSPTHALNKDQVLSLFHEVSKSKYSYYLHTALFITFFTTGLRKSEILNLKFKDFKTYFNQYILLYKGKGGKIDQKLLHPICVRAIKEYIQWMKEEERDTSDEAWIFRPTRNPNDPKNLDKRLNPKTINKLFDTYARKISLGVKLTPHSARATFISELLEAGVDIYSVALEVSHSSVETTQEYDKRRKKLLESPILKLKWD